MSEPIPSDIGKALKAARESKGWTLKALAEKSGLSVSYLSDIERERTLPSLPTLHKLAHAFGYTKVGINFGYEDETIDLLAPSQLEDMLTFLGSLKAVMIDLIASIIHLEGALKAVNKVVNPDG